MDTIIVFSAKYLIYFSAAIALVWFFYQPRKEQKEILIFAIILFPVSYLIAKIAGYFYFDPRPFVAGNFTPLIPHAADNGFPSDHTLLGAAIALSVFRFNKKLGLVLFFLAVLLGAARVAAGVHHTADIIGSIIVVSVVYFFARFYAVNLFKKYLS